MTWKRSASAPSCFLPKGSVNNGLAFSQSSSGHLDSVESREILNVAGLCFRFPSIRRSRPVSKSNRENAKPLLTEP